MLIFNKLRTQQALGGLEISNGSGGSSCCGGGLPSLALYLREGGACRWAAGGTGVPEFSELYWDKIRRGGEGKLGEREPGKLRMGGQGLWSVGSVGMACEGSDGLKSSW